jgi:hypothetical protein
MHTKRDYFTIWTAAWLFYALWLTLGLQEQKGALSGGVFMLRQSCVAISAVFLLWGSFRFLGLHTRQNSFGLFMLFLLVWIVVTPQVFSNPLQIQLVQADIWKSPCTHFKSSSACCAKVASCSGLKSKMRIVSGLLDDGLNATPTPSVRRCANPLARWTAAPSRSNGAGQAAGR